jgi:hypothetical protein
MVQKIKAVMIVEVAGKPPEFLKKSLESHVSRLDQNKDVSSISKNFSEPKKSEEGDFYTCFCEIEFEVPTFLRLMEIIFDFMPSSIEIIEPGKIEMSPDEATFFANNLTGRLHRYDEIARLAQFKMKEMAEMINHLQKEKTEQKPAKKTTKKAKKTKA